MTVCSVPKALHPGSILTKIGRLPTAKQRHGKIILERFLARRTAFPEIVFPPKPVVVVG
jgi:hypothetical protein